MFTETSQFVNLPIDRIKSEGHAKLITNEGQFRHYPSNNNKNKCTKCYVKELVEFNFIFYT